MLRHALPPPVIPLRPLAVPALALLLLAAPTTLAHHPWCDEPCHEDQADLTLPGTFYVVHESSGAVYVYQESNGVAGLQRCDPDHLDGNCGCPPDTLIV